MMTSNLIFGGYGNISLGDIGSNDDIVGGDDGCDESRKYVLALVCLTF